ncbi:MAG: hypothetical protein ACYDA2_10685 [Acidimicrobiales bacterium]
MNDTARRFEVPELAAATVLVVVGLLAIGGLVSAVASLWETGYGIQPSSQRAANALLTGTGWAHPFTALFLLAAVVLLRWHRSRGDDDGERTVATWLEVGLLVTSAGAIAAFVGALLSFVGTQGGSPSTSVVVVRDVDAAVILLATVAVTAAGLVIGGRLRLFRADR